jgi:hypothetical protein
MDQKIVEIGLNIIMAAAIITWGIVLARLSLGQAQFAPLTKRVTIIFIVVSPLLIILNFWIEGWDYWVRSLTISAGPLSLAMFLLYPIIAAILLKKQVRGAFAFAALGIFFAAAAVALTLYHQTETGRVMMLRAARAVLG